MIPIQMVVNGSAVTDQVEPRTQLADFLRERLGLTGTHLRCEQGVCGVCTVLIDGHPARSCITYAVLCDGAEISTIEGLEDDPLIARLRNAFSAEHGLQCGFCTPAMLITARDIIMRFPEADEKKVRTELSGNLCRCTGYVGIIRAVCRAIAELRENAVPAPAQPKSRLGPVGARPADVMPRKASQPELRPDADTLSSAIALPTEISGHSLWTGVKTSLARYLRRINS